MELTSAKVIKNLLEKYGTRPFKGWGQNFLIDKSVLKKIIDSASLKKSDIVLEIGPGIGTLTQELAKKTKKVIAIEKDKKMCEILKDLLECLPRTEPKVLVRGWNVRNVKIIKGDILKLDPKPYTLKPYKVVANLPYYIVSPVIRKFLENTGVQPLQMILMVQKEVAQRICDKPPNMSILAVSVQFYAEPKILFYVSKNSFWPRPKVDGAVIKITPFDWSKKFAWAHSHFASRRRASAFRMLFFRIVKAGFSQPRKQLVNNLSKMLKLDKEKVKDWLLKNGIQPGQRAETLSVEDWVRLTKDYKKLITI
jgi:16S rRNA (adenine1518-N6/adenine1519-N6)-dimethyltransferase